MPSLRRLRHERAKDAQRWLAWPYRRASSATRSLPHFLIIGAQKAGTTSLFHYLSQHRQIQPGFRKEVHYFDGGLLPEVDNYVNGEHWYRAHFPRQSQLGQYGLTGEATPLYLFNPLAAARIRALIPNIKLIAILRNPADRAISHYLHERARGREPLSFSDALNAEEDRLRLAEDTGNFKDFAYIHYSYKRRGLYSEQLERFARQFDRDQLLVLSSDALFAQPKATLDRVLGFLGVDEPFNDLDLAPRNMARVEGDVAAETYAYLNRYFATETEKIRHRFNVDLGSRTAVA